MQLSLGLLFGGVALQIFFAMPLDFRFCDLWNIWHSVKNGANWKFLCYVKTMCYHKATRQLRIVPLVFVLATMTNFIGLDGRYVRIASRKPVENDRLIEALQDYRC